MPEMQYYRPIQFKGKDATELLYVSSLLQDALCPITAMTYSREKQTFTLLINRFCWEMCDHFDHHSAYFRVHSSLTIQNVQAVRKRNFHQKNEIRTLNLLALATTEGENAGVAGATPVLTGVAPSTAGLDSGVVWSSLASLASIGVDGSSFDKEGATSAPNDARSTGASIQLLFSGDIEILLAVDDLAFYMKDFDHPWPTHKKPMHWHEHRAGFLNTFAIDNLAPNNVIM